MNRLQPHPDFRRTDLPIGMFDSGVGGLTVWRELRKQLPYESIIYFGDTARIPYGVKTVTEILHYVRSIVHWLLTHPVKLIVMACNTSSALVLEQVRQACPVPVLGLILPGAKAAVEVGSRIGVLATPATTQSQAYQRAIIECGARVNKQVLCWEQACPDFVPLIESNQLDSPQLQLTARQYLDPLLIQSIDTLVYGCTHYPLLAPLLHPLLPSTVRVVDPAIALAASIRQELDLWGILQSHPPTDINLNLTQFFVSGDPETFANLAINWLGQKPQVTQVAESSPYLI